MHDNTQSSCLVVAHFTKRQFGAICGECVMHPFFHRSDGSLLRHLGIASSSGAVRFGSLKLPMAPFTAPWASLGFALSQALCLGSPDFVANCLDTLRFHANKRSFKQICVLFLLNSILSCFTFFIQTPAPSTPRPEHTQPESPRAPRRDAPPFVHHPFSFLQNANKKRFLFFRPSERATRPLITA